MAKRLTTRANHFWTTQILVYPLLGVLASVSLGDEFDRLTGQELAGLLRNSSIVNRKSLDFGELEGLPSVLRDVRSALVIGRTDQGNLFRMLVSPGFRKRPVPKDAPVPILVLERFMTMDGGNPSARVAQGKDIVLFPGFELDLDSGQVVPTGLGGDLGFSIRDQAGESGVLRSLGSAGMATLREPARLTGPLPGLPSEGRVVIPTDFSGRFRLVANSQWTGSLELTANAMGSVTGKFQSDASGSISSVTGTIDPAMPSKIAFTIDFPRAKQEYQGLLWTEGKNAITGSMSMLQKEFGFLAAREGVESSLTGTSGLVKVRKSPGSVQSPIRIRVEEQPDHYAIGRTQHTRTSLMEALATALRPDPQLEVHLTATATTPFSRLREAIETIEAVGVKSIRLVPATDLP